MEPEQGARLRQLMRESLERLRRFQKLDRELQQARALQAQRALEQRRQARLQADELMRQAWLLKHQGCSAVHALSRHHSSTDVSAHVSSRVDALGPADPADRPPSPNSPRCLHIPTVMVELYPEQQTCWPGTPSPGSSSSSSTSCTQIPGEEGHVRSASVSGPTPSPVQAPATPEPAAAPRQGVDANRRSLWHTHTSTVGQEAIEPHQRCEHEQLVDQEIGLLTSSVNQERSHASASSCLCWERLHAQWEARWFGGVRP